MPLFKIDNLNYEIDEKIFFKDFNLEIESGEYVSIIAPNKSGKSMLTKIICAIIPTTDFCILDNISLNKENVLRYIKEIGIVINDIENPFIFKKVKDELKYPLENLGYNAYQINKKITKICNYFEIEDLLNKNINDLNKSEKSELLIILSLIHEPKLLVLDDSFNNMDSSTKKFMLQKLQELNNDGLTILNITSKLDTVYNSSKVYVMDKFKIISEGETEKILKKDSELLKIGLEIPYIIDLSLKLMSYGIIDKIYFNDYELENAIWN